MIQSTQSGPFRFAHWILASVLLAGTSVAIPARAEETPEAEVAPDLKRAMEYARDEVFPALVSIVVSVEVQSQGRHRLYTSGGSGTIISPDGLIVTNAHVTMDATRFRVILSDKREVIASLVGEDPLSDIAVLKINMSELPKNYSLPQASFGDSSKLNIGDYVLAMGAPWGLSSSLTLGVVSNNERVFVRAGGDDADYESDLDRDQPTGSYYRWIQHDASISPGNSGGPLVNLEGKIVGVNTRANAWGGDMAFASPSHVVQDVVEQLIDKGEVIRSFLGIYYKPIKTTDYDYGVFVNSVVDDSPANEAGIQPGDLIVAIDGKPVTVRYAEEMPEFRRNLAQQPVGTKLTFTIERDGARQDISVATSQYQKDLGDRAELKEWGFTIRDLTPRMARNRRLPSHDGVLVTGVEVGRPAQEAKPPLEYGDVILKIEDQNIVNIDDFMNQYDRFTNMEDKPEHILVEFEREAGRYVTAMKTEDDEDQDRPVEVDKAWIGVEVQPVVKDLSEELGLGDQSGFRLVRVYENTLAASSELQVGDVIVQLNGKKLKPRNDEDRALFQQKVRRLEIGDDATLTVLRAGKEKEISVKLEPTRETPEEAKRAKNRDFDFEVRNITFFDIANERWSWDTQGVLVIQVERGGWAGVGHLRTDDLLIEINDRKIDTVETFEKVMEEIEKEKPEKVRFLVMRGIETRYLFVETDWEARD